ncbi:MAG: preprotein translocase subunit SecE [Firmicutes bacterium]|nr:preprotein translocase subunit SecE [Bacillota bacterium]
MPATTAEARKPGRVKAFLKGVLAELKKVHWPTKKQLINYTGVVILAVVAMALVISLYDWIVSTLIQFLLSL